jgi:hypothetical protein
LIGPKIEMGGWPLLFYNKMPILWIHRAFASDMLVRFSSSQEAYDFGKKFLEQTSSDLSPPTINEYNEINVGCNGYIQIYIEKDNFKPSEGWHYWNSNGCKEVTREKAEELGKQGEEGDIV